MVACLNTHRHPFSMRGLLLFGMLILTMATYKWPTHLYCREKFGSRTPSNRVDQGAFPRVSKDFPMTKYENYYEGCPLIPRDINQCSKTGLPL